MRTELRWLMAARTTTESPKLQFRTCEIFPHWGEWEDVPYVVAPPKPINVPEQRTTCEHGVINGARYCWRCAEKDLVCGGTHGS